MEFLQGQNRVVGGELATVPVVAAGKRVVVIGGGDTGSDCVGTSIRQGAASVLQIEIMPKPPAERSPSTPWPMWPYVLRTSSSHKEGGERRWNISTRAFAGERGHVTALETVEVEWEFSPAGRPLKFAEIPGSERRIEADLVLLAMGFTRRSARRRRRRTGPRGRSARQGAGGPGAPHLLLRRHRERRVAGGAGAGGRQADGAPGE